VSSDDSGETPGRRRFTNTLAGEGTPAPAVTNEAEPTDSRRRYVSTIVGHPTATSGAAGPLAPVLAPPRWRGAKAYLEGDEPQLRVSAIPTPPPVTAAQAAAAASGSPSRVTTKMGPPPSEVSPAPPPGESNAAIGDAIQEMLDGQASVPMQVEEQNAEALDEIPIVDLPIEEILDGFSAPDVLPPPSVPSAGPPPVPGAAASAGTEPELDTSERNTSPLPPPPPTVEPLQAHGPAALSAATSAQPEREAALGPRPVARVELKRRHASVDPVPERARPVASSLAPAEVAKRGRGDDAQSGLGLLLVAAMVVIGFGGWLLTQGGYPGPAHRVAEPPKPTAAETTTPPRSPGSQPAPGTAVASLPPVVASAPPAVARASDERSGPSERAQKSGSRHEHGAAAAKPASPEPKDSTPAQAPAETSTVLRVTPRDSQADLPDTPSRDNVLSALAPIRATVSECARGQHGLAQLDITVSSAGFVTYAVVGGDFAGTPEGSCIARAARSAQFVAFKKPRFRVIYPFSL
jgi:hypothetical protein